MKTDDKMKIRHNKPGYQSVLSTLAKKSLRSQSGLTLELVWKTASYKYCRWADRQSRTVLSRMRLYEPPSIDDVTKQAGILCRDFIYQRLKRQNLLSVKLELRPSAARSSEVALEIQSLADALERQYPHLYHHICRQLNIVMSTEAVTKCTLQSLADVMFASGPVTWGRVVSLFLLAGVLSTECMQQGHPEFVRSIVEVFQEVTRLYLAEWIVIQGGWYDVTRVFRAAKSASSVWVVTGVGAFVGFVFTLVTTLSSRVTSSSLGW